MGGHHPNNHDLRPKRRRDKDNPYEIYTVGAETECPHYYLSFEVEGAQHSMEINKALFDTLNGFELDDLSFMNEVDRHYEHSEQSEGALSRRALHPNKTVEEIFFQQVELDMLRESIALLPESQRRRLILYYFENHTYEEIAEMEGCTFQAVAKSISKAELFLKKFLAGG